MILLPVVFVKFIDSDNTDIGKDSLNIERFLEPDPEFPFIGFWKEDCSQNFGLAIAKTVRTLGTLLHTMQNY